jgi:hypothetical protein
VRLDAPRRVPARLARPRLTGEAPAGNSTQAIPLSLLVGGCFFITVAESL